MPLYTADNVVLALNKVVTGSGAINDDSKRVFHQLLAFHVWLRLQNQNNKTIQLKNVDATKAAQAGLRFIRAILLESNEDAQNYVNNNPADLSFTQVQGYLGLEINQQTEVSGILRSILLNDSSEALSLKEYAEALLNDLKTFLNNTQNKLGTDDTNIKDQLKIFTARDTEIANTASLSAEVAAPSIPERSINFVLRASLFTLFFPWTWLIAGGMGAYYSLRQATAQDRPYYDRAQSRNYFQKAATTIANVFLAMIFEPIRYVFSYNDWDEDSKKNFDAAEALVFKGALFVLALPLVIPFTFFGGLAKTLEQVWANYKKIWNCTTEEGLRALLPQEVTDAESHETTYQIAQDSSPYGLGLLRGVLWLKDTVTSVWGKTPAPLKYLLGAAFWPVTLLYGGYLLGERAGILPPSIPTQAKAIALLSWIFLPADVACGLLVKGYNAIVPDSQEYEKYKISPLTEFTINKWFCIAEFSFLMSSFGAIVWGGLIATAWTPIVKIFPGVGSWGDVFRAIWNTPFFGGAWAKTLWFGGAGSPGLFVQGADAFAAGMKSFGFGMRDFFVGIANPQVWAEVGNFFQSIPKVIPALPGVAFEWMGRIFGPLAALVVGYQGYKHYDANKSVDSGQQTPLTFQNLFSSLLPWGTNRGVQKTQQEVQQEAVLRINQQKCGELKVKNTDPTTTVTLSVAVGANDNNKGSSPSDATRSKAIFSSDGQAAANPSKNEGAGLARSLSDGKISDEDMKQFQATQKKNNGRSDNP